MYLFIYLVLPFFKNTNTKRTTHTDINRSIYTHIYLYIYFSFFVSFLTANIVLPNISFFVYLFYFIEYCIFYVKNTPFIIIVHMLSRNDTSFDYSCIESILYSCAQCICLLAHFLARVLKRLQT